MIESAIEVVPAAKPITIKGVQAMIWAILTEQMEETRQLLLDNKREFTAPVNELVLNEGPSKEGSYNRIVD